MVASARNSIQNHIVGSSEKFTLSYPASTSCTDDTWTPTSTGTNVPSPRKFATAVWTGSEMIVWGGVSMNSGGRYVPATDTWTATPVGGNAPSARFGHTAVWTGTVMIIWGGTNTGAATTGHRHLDSHLDWSELPFSAFGHTAVWTGTEMIVWGGTHYDDVTHLDSNAHVNTGGRYKPATDTWIPTSTGPNVPVARSNHTAVWTGTEMIVWGGVGSDYYQTGGRYNPSTDSWMPTSTGGLVPFPRQDHTAVWTGTEMIVWGGSWNSSTMNSGGRYKPATDTWTWTSDRGECP